MLISVSSVVLGRDINLVLALLVGYDGENEEPHADNSHRIYPCGVGCRHFSRRLPAESAAKTVPWRGPRVHGRKHVFTQRHPRQRHPRNTKHQPNNIPLNRKRISEQPEGIHVRPSGKRVPKLRESRDALLRSGLERENPLARRLGQGFT